MDIRCPKCGEPWDMDTLHDEVLARNPDEQPWYTKLDPRCNKEFTHNDEVRICAAVKDHVGEHRPYNSEISFNSNKGMFYNGEVYSKYFSAVQREWRAKGCEALREAYGGTHNKETLNNKASTLLLGVLYDALGDDFDGVAAMTEDAEMMGLFDD